MQHHPFRQLPQVAQRSRCLVRVAMRPDQTRVGEHLQQRFDVHRMRRHLQAPGARRGRLQHLQIALLVFVGARHVGFVKQPFCVARRRQERVPRQALEVLVVDEHVLGRAVGVFPVRQRHFRLLDHLHNLALLLQQGQTSWIGAQRLGAGRWYRIHALPVEQRTACRVLVEQVADDSRAGAGHAENEQRTLDGRVEHFGVRLNVGVHLHAPPQGVGRVIEDAFPAERSECR